MMAVIHIQVTVEDIEDAKNYGLGGPIEYAVQRLTGTPWYIADDGIMLEATPPHRTVTLRGEALERWHTYQATKVMAPFEFQAELITPAS